MATVNVNIQDPQPGVAFSLTGDDGSFTRITGAEIQTAINIASSCDPECQSLAPEAKALILKLRAAWPSHPVLFK